MRHRARSWFGGMGALLVALWLGIALLASSPHLHLLLHSDAHGQEHSCAIELVSHGSLLFHPAPDCLTPETRVLRQACETSSVPFFGRDFRIALSRGPPSVHTSRTVAG